MITGKETHPQVDVPIPGPNAQGIVDKDTDHLATTTKTSPVVGARALGAVVEDVDGNVLLDFTSGIGVVNLGHCHPDVVAAVQDQAGKLMHFAGTDFYYDVQAELGRRLAESLPGPSSRKIFYTNSGAESIEAALKAVRWSTRRPQFLAFQGAFHGRTMGAVSLTASKLVQRARYFPTMPGVTHIPFPDPYRNVWGIDGYEEPDELSEKALGYLEDFAFRTHVVPEEVGAIFAEPVQGEGGYVVPPAGYYKKLQKLCKDHGILFVADEVQAGFGRTGLMFGMEHEDVTADIVCLAKGIANGMPMGAVALSKELDFGEPGAHSNTYGGNLVACRAAMAVLEAFGKEPILDNVVARGAQLSQRLRELQETVPEIGDIRGRGLMICADFVTDPRSKAYHPKFRNKIVEEAYKAGLMLLPCGPSGIRFIPPLTVSEAQVAGAMEVFAASVKKAQ